MSGAVRAARLRRHALRWRALSTQTDELANAVAHQPSPVSRIEPHRERDGAQQNIHRRMIFVRPWDGIPTMAHTFAIVRDIERRFGKIQDFVVIRDSDVLSSCSPFLHAIFSREEDADAIPLGGKVIQVVAPVVASERDGGIGLDDLYVYLDPETREKTLLDRESAPEKESEWGPPEGKVIDVKLERTGLRDPPMILDHSFGFSRRGPPHLNNPIRTRELAHAICAFGGFVDQPSHIQGRQTPMQAVVSRWSRMVRQPPPPQPRSDLAQENIVDENSAEESEEPAILEENTQWTPFEASNVVTPSVSPSTSSTHLPVTPLSSSPPLSPSPVSSSTTSWSRPTLEAVAETHIPKLDSKPKPKPESKPKPSVTPVEPKMSRKLRLLNAARLAGAMAAEKPPDTAKEPMAVRLQAPSPVPDPSAEHSNAAVGHDTKGSEKNKLAARRWWKFLTGGGN